MQRAAETKHPRRKIFFLDSAPQMRFCSEVVARMSARGAARPVFIGSASVSLDGEALLSSLTTEESACGDYSPEFPKIPHRGESSQRRRRIEASAPPRTAG